MELTREKRSELRKMINNYNTVGAFVSERKVLTYMQFDYALSRNLTLFMTEPQFSFEALESKIDEIVKTLPAIKRIFAQPTIHLKEKDIILPTENVRIINNKTIRHASSHVELWSDIKDGEVVPSKLLTRTYEDNYGIYENLVFCQTVDEILSFARTYARFLKELIYANRSIEINLLERVNHLNYFLALGKLHIGYSRNFDAYYDVTMRCLNKLQFITNSIVPRLKRPVYKNNKVRPEQIKIRKTNILSMHKQYHQIYKLAKYFSLRRESDDVEITDKDLKNLQKNYFDFCQALCVFAVGHFNFACDEDKQVSFERLNITFKFKGWTLNVKRLGNENERLLLFTFNKDVEYKVAVVPYLFEEYEGLLSDVKVRVQADEYVVFAPYERYVNGVKQADITSIQSFRRVQQIILKGMIYSDVERVECPFCEKKLTYNQDKSFENNAVYECFSCRTEIHDRVCLNSGIKYSSTRIAELSKVIYDEDDDDLWLAERKREAQMYFRNITEITDDLEEICPICNKVH